MNISSNAVVYFFEQDENLNIRLELIDNYETAKIDDVILAKRSKNSFSEKAKLLKTGKQTSWV